MTKLVEILQALTGEIEKLIDKNSELKKSIDGLEVRIRRLEDTGLTIEDKMEYKPYSEI